MAKYTLQEHTHRFALWAAARAAQRGLRGGRNDVLARALENSGIRSVAWSPRRWPTSASAFDRLHHRWCGAIMKRGPRSMSYGRAAKLVAIYLKVTVVCSQPASRFSDVLHPPIDDLLLKELASKHDHLRRALKGVRWTTLTEEKYDALIAYLRPLVKRRPFWTLEADWEFR